ncbi:GUN4 domain-containing protein [Nostoc sp. XA013]|nr:GUN4 domain-containing protein [Nostoc sp. XA013]
MSNFIGRVVDQKNQPIKDAKVSFEGLGTPLVNYTDTEGIFRFSIQITSGSVVNVNIRVEAEGYKPYNRYTDLFIVNTNIEEIRLIKNDTENSNSPLAAIRVAKIGAIATVAVALIAGGVMLVSKFILTQKTDPPVDVPGQQTPSPTNSTSSSKPSLLTSEPQATDLNSEKGVDYTKLRNFLKAGQWKEADIETLAVMLKAANKVRDGYLTVESIQIFPCKDLRTIDSLWVKYSNGHFGFSIQKKNYLEVDGILDGNYYEETFGKYGLRVGWKEKERWISYNNELTFDTKYPKGYLPLAPFTYLPRNGHPFGYLLYRYVVPEFFYRCETCKV